VCRQTPPPHNLHLKVCRQILPPRDCPTWSLCFRFHLQKHFADERRKSYRNQVIMILWSESSHASSWSKETPSPGKVSYLLCSQIKILEEEDSLRRTRCFDGGPLPLSTWLGNLNIVNSKPPRGMGLLSIKVIIKCPNYQSQWWRAEFDDTLYVWRNFSYIKI